MTVFSMEENQGVWFELEGGGKVQLRTMSIDAYNGIRKKTVKKKVDFKKIEGTPVRLEYEEVDEDLQNELFWDHVIVSWENFFDAKENPILCTKANKIMLMTKSPKFFKIVTANLESLNEDEVSRAEVSEKN